MRNQRRAAFFVPRIYVRHRPTLFPGRSREKYIEAISLLKLNVFHWHLSDDQGWRVQIDKYPRLTEHGSMRRETCGDKKPHGGFYTKEQIKDVVEFAKERFITVIPEFDIPGHTRAAVSSYPELGAAKSPWKCPRNSEFTAKYFARDEKNRTICQGRSYGICGNVPVKIHPYRRRRGRQARVVQMQ